MKRIGLFFGSFNPIHVGHLIIANHVLEYGAIDQIWMVVSPHNPLKEKKSLLNQYERLNLVEIATKKDDRIMPSDIEFKLPQPSYTIDTLTYLKEKKPNHEFKLIMGGDNLANIHKWKNHDILLRDYDILVYRRPGHEFEIPNDRVEVIDAPLLEISSTMIRQMIKEDRSVKYLLSEPVHDFINREQLYKQ